MTVSNKIKTLDNKIEQNKARYDLDSQTTKISDLSSENAGKYEFSNRWRSFSRKRIVRKNYCN